MRLAKFRVQNFRSIKDTGWVSVDDWTCLVGPNEAGKSNILRALHRLNPADNKTRFELNEDCPHEIRLHANKKDSPETFFAHCLFELNDDDKEKISHVLLASPEGLSEDKAKEFVDACQLVEFARTHKNKRGIWFYSAYPEKRVPNPIEKNHELYKALIPKFCYYDKYATLDAKIKLPEAIEQLAEVYKNPDSAAYSTMQDQLLDIFLTQIDPEYRQNFDENNSFTNDERAEYKEERRLILDSLATNLRKRLNNQWQAGKYSFHFDIDGDDLSIRVSDDKRDEKILLSARGAGMQAFFSLLLLCEHTKTQGTSPQILLFDEPGAHLHPTAQQDLSSYFTEFAKQQQLIYTTHSPFMIDHNHIDRVKGTYVGKDGHTAISDNLSRPLDNNQAAFLPLYAALGISISETLFLGCDVLLVEGVSDQIYLLAIKQRLLRQKTWTRNKELIIIPVNGAGKMPYHASFLATSGHLPLILLDSDQSGDEAKKNLIRRFHGNDQDNILQIGEYCQGKEKAEIEDFLAKETIVSAVNEYYKLTGDRLINTNELLGNETIAKQIEKLLNARGIKNLAETKVDIARIVKKMIEKDDDFPIQPAWQELFDAISTKLENQNVTAIKRSE